MKKYAFVEYGGKVMGVETRCSCRLRSEKQAGELAIEDIVHPDLVYRYVEIPEGVAVTEGMLYSGGEFKENPVSAVGRVAALEAQQAATNEAVLGLMDMLAAVSTN